jgi:hypothetical protein
MIIFGAQSIIKTDANFKGALLLLCYFETNNVQATCLLHGENISPLLSTDLSKYALDFDLHQIKHNALCATGLG